MRNGVIAEQYSGQSRLAITVVYVVSVMKLCVFVYECVWLYIQLNN